MANDPERGRRGPVDRLKQEGKNILLALGRRALVWLARKAEPLVGKVVGQVKDRLESAGMLDAVQALLAGKGIGGILWAAGKGLLRRAGRAILSALGLGGAGRPANIVETLDVGAPLRVVYEQWTRFEDFPSFMKKVESVHQEADEKLDWKAQVFLSHRTWRADIVEQVPEERIIWRSTGAKGHVDGAVGFHALAPQLTRIVLVLEYHPKGLFERVGNLWRAQGRRARLEFKHFGRHVMTRSMLHPEEVRGWRGEIHDGRVTRDDETVRREEQEAAGEPEGAEPVRSDLRGGNT